eukprot:TRINITY_DN13628_c0_g1_i1.p1 TRINITY_DN13628_c0_g1~~TRINITY_DN13628_c0_g1_i1.p1  ORF type:complete len:262 (+),score=62.63 TRINITY_DN13628_c0_g1_i1:44-829(+)
MAKNVKVCVVLGQSLDKGQMSDILMQRCVSAAAFYHRVVHDGDQCCVMVSGGDPAKAGITEAKAMHQALTGMGVASRDVILEDQATTTLENAFYLLPHIASLQERMKVNDITLITSGFHMPRALYMFEAVFADRTLPNAMAKPPACHALPSPSACRISPDAALGVTGMTLIQLLEKERACIRNRLVQHQLANHIKFYGRGKTPVAPLCPERFQHAIRQVEAMGTAVQRGGDWQELPAFYQVCTGSDTPTPEKKHKEKRRVQ